MTMSKRFRILQNKNMQIKSGVIILLMSIPIVSLLLLCLSMPQVSRAFLVLLAGVPTALAVAVAGSAHRQMTRQLNAITTLFHQFEMGEYEARAAVLSGDELGSLADGLNRMLDTTLMLTQFQEEYEAMQVAMRKLQEEMAAVAAGDLTIEAEATSEMLQALAEPFNHLIHQLRAVVTHVQENTLQVGAQAHAIQATAAHLAEDSTAQAAQIIDGSAAIGAMAVSMQRVSDNATLSAQVAEQALTNAQKGTRAVQNTITALDRTRAQVEETAARITALGEHSREVETIVQLIGDIADRTSVLALNAAIEAALAGEAGQGFAIIAAEVERLAQRAADATRQTIGLVQTIQTETHRAVTAMAESTREVSNGVQVANQAGQALGKVERGSARLVELIQSLSLAAQQQARGSEQLSQAMSETAEVTQHTATGTRQAAVSISRLATLSSDLQASVSIFKLPAQSHKYQEAA
jgi:twitching motility protein PilJ